jgi:hypothetical protein
MVLGNCEVSIVERETIALAAGDFLMERRSCKVEHWIQHWIEHWAQLGIIVQEGERCHGDRCPGSVRRFINSPEIF